MDGYRTPPHKLVLDWDHRPVGRVRDARRDPRTNAISSIVVSLTGDAQRRMAAGTSELEIPVRFVFSLRAGEVVLDRPLEALRVLQTLVVPPG